MAKQPDGAAAAAAGEVLRPLLEQAVRESLREIARSAAQPEPGGSSRSIECIVRGAACRVLEEAGDALAPLRTPSESQRPRSASKAAPEPLLQDLAATPWVIWREGASHPPHAAHPPQGAGVHEPAAAVEAELAATDEESVPEDASRCPRQAPASSGESPECSESPSGGGRGQRAAGGAPWSAAQAAAADAAAIVNPKRVPHPRASLPMHAARAGTRNLGQHGSGADGCSTIGDSPIVVREGLKIESNGTQHLMMQWNGRPRSVLMIAKPGDPLVVATLQDVAAWLSSQGIVVVLEPQLLADQPDLRNTLQRARTFSRSDRLEKCIDLIITLGGDGTLTWAVSLFRGAMPPVLSFAAGSLGFLTPFPLDGWVRTLTQLLDLHRPRSPLPLACRMRLCVAVRRRRSSSGDGTFDAADGGGEEGLQVQCLNEVLVHRGQSGALAKLDIGVDGERVTLVQGDGIILATPTGSTAYSLAAGGSMVHPGVPAILLTPVSPHSLSFRPAVLPDSAVVTIGVPLTARCGAALSVDGKDICTLRLGDCVEVAMSPHPVPTICRNTETGDWFASVHEALQWNGRLEQK